jgi:hypothetical protein
MMGTLLRQLTSEVLLLIFFLFFVWCRMINGLKDYTVEALVSTVDHLGFVSYKVNNLITEKVDEVSEAELMVSTVEQVH